MKRTLLVTASIVIAAVLVGSAQTRALLAQAAPDPQVEYLYDVAGRRHYDFPNNDALSYGRGICDKVTRGENYAHVTGDVKNDVNPNDEFAANYLVSYAVNLLCPDQIWQQKIQRRTTERNPGS